MATADGNRSINLCLINTLKPTEDLPDNNRIGIDHVNSFIWFDDKAQRDNYLALKTVHSQTQNSKIHDFNEVKALRFDIKMKDYYKLDADLVKVSHTVDGLENNYIYNIVDVNYINNNVTEVSVRLNEIYTYFMGDDKEREQMQGVLMKSNFKNENVDMAYINDVSKGLVGDSYGASEYTSGVKKVIQGDDFDKNGISWLVVSMRKKPTVFDDGTSGWPKTMNRAFSDEIIISLPFKNADGEGADFTIQGGSTPYQNKYYVGYIAFLILNGAIKVDTSSGETAIGALADAYGFLKQMPFTFASFYDVQEIGIIPDYPSDYSVSGTTVSFPNNPGLLTLTLEDRVERKEAKLTFLTYENIDGDNLHLRQDHIVSNADKQTKLMDGFENWENNLIYNRYSLKYYNALTILNPFNIFGSNLDLYVKSVYLGANFRKLFVSTDIGINSLNTKDQVSGANNTDYVIKFAGQSEGGSVLGEYQTDRIISDMAVMSGLFSSVVTGGISAGATAIGAGAGFVAGGPLGAYLGGQAGGAVGGAVTGAVGPLMDQAMSIPRSQAQKMASEYSQPGGTTGYNTGAFNSSPLYHSLEEYIPKIVLERSGKTTTIDLQTNFYGTSCSLFTNNLKSYTKDIINNRKNHACYIAGDFNVNYLYPQVNQRLKATLQGGVLFKKKLQ